MKRILTTIWCDGDEEWNGAVELVDRRTQSHLSYLRSIVRRARDHDVVILVGSLGARDRYIDLVAAGLLKLRRRRPVVIITDATWEVGSRTLERRLGSFGRRVLPRIASTAIRAIDGDHVRYCVLSSDELATFPATWGIDQCRVRYTPFFVTLYEWLDAATHDGGYVFAGGDSLRDYDLLVGAVESLDVDVHIAASSAADRGLPNVHTGRVPHERYMDLLLGAKLVVVPLQVSTRSAGQQTYLNAMAAGKPVIVTEAPGVRDYVEHGVTGLVVPPDVDALRTAIAWVLDPTNAEEVALMAARARDVARERFDPVCYRRLLLELAEAEVGAPA